MTRNQPMVAGAASSNRKFLAIVAPAYWEIAPRTKSCSGPSGSGARATPAPAARSVEEVRVGPADLLPQRLEAEPSGEREAGVLARVRGHLVRDLDGRARRLGHELGLARALHRDEPERRFLDRLADGEQP